MIVGVPQEVKTHEYRVGLVPAGVRELVERGHEVVVQAAAGQGAGISDEDYRTAGARVVASAEEVYSEAELIVKVKEPQPSEYAFLRPGQVLFTYLHLAANSGLTQALLEHDVVGIAYETVQLDDGSLPLLAPMSEVAGKLAVQVGAHWLQRENGGSGVLLGGVPGALPGEVTVIGGGVVGTNAAKVALGMGARVTLLDINLARLRYLADVLEGHITLLHSDLLTIERAVTQADLVIGAVLVPGAKASKVVTRGMMSAMRPGSVIVDVAIDQGGCVEGAVPTTHDDPVLRIDGVTLFCVANLPASAATTATYALTNATLSYVVELAELGYREALRSDTALRRGLNVFRGKVTCQPVAEGVGLDYCPYEELLI